MILAEQARPLQNPIANGKLQSIQYINNKQEFEIPLNLYTDDHLLDRCFICLGEYGDVGSANILIPCGHGWCCDSCGLRLNNCPICTDRFPRMQQIQIMHVNYGTESKQFNNILFLYLGKLFLIFLGTWIQNNNLADPTGSQCLGCMRQMRDVPNRARYIYIYCGHGWFCSECILPLPATCEICNDTIDGSIRMYIQIPNVITFCTYYFFWYT